MSCVNMSDCSLTKIMGKRRDFFSKLSQNENICVKMGELFPCYSKFSYDFCQCYLRLRGAVERCDRIGGCKHHIST